MVLAIGQGSGVNEEPESDDGAMADDASTMADDAGAMADEGCMAVVLATSEQKHELPGADNHGRERLVTESLENDTCTIGQSSSAEGFTTGIFRS